MSVPSSSRSSAYSEVTLRKLDGLSANDAM